VGREEIVTPRLTLRPVTPELAQALVDGDLSGVVPGHGWPHEDTLDGIGSVPRGSTAWLICMDGVVIGDCGTFAPKPGSRDVEIGYGLAEPYRGRGYARELIPALARQILAWPDPPERVLASVEAGNAASRRALEHGGFTAAGERDGFVVYELDATGVM